MWDIYQVITVFIIAFVLGFVCGLSIGVTLESVRRGDTENKATLDNNDDEDGDALKQVIRMYGDKNGKA